MIGERILPRSAVYGLRRVKAAYLRRRFYGMTTEQIFTYVYRQNVWGGRRGEFHSGIGSAPEFSAQYVGYVKSFVHERGIKSVLDLGCGDFRVGRMLADEGIEYTGVDIVRELIERNNAEYGSERVRFVAADIVTAELPGADLVLARQVLQHLANSQVAMVLEKLREYPYALVTEHLPSSEYDRFSPNAEKLQGPDTRLNVNSGVVIGVPPFDRGTSMAVLTTKIPGGGRRYPEVLRTWLLTSSP